MPHHLRPSAKYAPEALLPGDPGRALALAQQLLTEPKMSNHSRGLWGYTGLTADGSPLSIQSTGIGGPSAAIVLEELAELGVRRAIRVGTCGALDPELSHGDLVVVGEALALDGASRALGADELALPDEALTGALERAAGGHPARVVSTDLFYGDRDDGAWLERGAVAIDLEAATLFALGSRLGIACGCLLAVTDTFENGRRNRISDEELEGVVERLGAAATAALTEAQR
jgi:purine-nucleoside phosphorylase